MTLIEIMIVVVLLTVLMGVAFPSMTGINRKNKLRAAAREIVALTKAARAEAVFGERTTSLVLDLNDQKYWLELREPEKEESRAKRLTGGKNQKKDKKGKSRFEQPRLLSDHGLVFDEVSAYDENILDDKKIAIDFFPDGSASPTLLSMKNTKEEVITIEILKATGATEITPGTVEEKRVKIQEAASMASAPPPPAGGSGGI